MEPGRQFEQLPMFMTARELRHGVESSDFLGKGSDEQWNDKASRATRTSSGADDNSTLAEHIAKHGVMQPVAVYHSSTVAGSKWLQNGHHRVATAYSQNPDSLIPVRHVEDSNYGDVDFDEGSKSPHRTPSTQGNASWRAK